MRELPQDQSVMALVAMTVLITLSPLMAGIAFAITVTNREERDVKVTITERQSRTDHVLRPAAVLDQVCLKGCILRLNESAGDDYELDGSASVAVENDDLYFADPPPGGEAGPRSLVPRPGSDKK